MFVSPNIKNQFGQDNYESIYVTDENDIFMPDRWLMQIEDYRSHELRDTTVKPVKPDMRKIQIPTKKIEMAEVAFQDTVTKIIGTRRTQTHTNGESLTSREYTERAENPPIQKASDEVSLVSLKNRLQSLKGAQAISEAQ